MRIISRISKSYSGPSCTPSKLIYVLTVKTLKSEIWCHTRRKGRPLCLDICSINLRNCETKAFVAYMKGKDYFNVLDVDGHMLLGWVLQKHRLGISEASIVTGYVLDDRGIGDQFFSSPHRLWS
jgi:hypothetical protein